MARVENDMAAVVAALREHDRFLVTSHEAPDGDALGSLLATELALRQLGKDSVMFLGGPAPLPGIAEALDIARVTVTGRFQYANTTPKALRLAADLVEAGADVNRVFQGVYENVQFAKLKLLARALDRARVLEGGEIVVSHLV